MSPEAAKEARLALGLTQEQMATLLGYGGPEPRHAWWLIESKRRPLREPQRRLLQAYLEGYRPSDWPERTQ